MCRLDMAHEFRGARLAYVRKILDILQRQFDLGEDLLFFPTGGRRGISVSSFKDAQIIYNVLCSQTDFRLRVQFKEISIYGLDKDWMKEIYTNISNPIEWWEPNTELHPVEPGQVILAKDNGHEFRVTIKGRLTEDAAMWLINNDDKVKYGPTFRNHLEVGMYYLENMYFYARNERCLSLLNIVMGNSIRRVDKVIALDKIA